MSALTDGGLPAAFLQSCAVYYGSALLLDTVLPAAIRPHGIQVGKRSKVSRGGPPPGLCPCRCPLPPPLPCPWPPHSSPLAPRTHALGAA